ncbi:RNA polymerase I-specific transcription-initiation factor-domain-containing protein [Mariannaea sp. PMI_226]|nr:RNA polymerase I-specific transcription-initiation factor-domain-containing protein [Mariannaea sp. PMI_226]
MADLRNQTDLLHGHVGRITYLPPKDPTSQAGLLHTSRITSDAPHIKVIGSSAELYPSSKSSIPEGSSNLWQERRTQRRWLLQSHPEAFMGNLSLQGLLEENMTRFQKFEGEVSDKPLLAVGQMTNVRDASRVTGTPMLATVTGESGELLRLAHIDESTWQWAGHTDMALNLSVIDPDDPEEEAIWASDGLPISQIKFATGRTYHGAIRWLLVQKQTSTTILQPLYHKIPVAQRDSHDLNVVKRLSRIDPNPIITLSHKQTGGNAHVDVAFNPRTRGQPSQIAVMDECGYWSLWNIIGTNDIGRNTMRVISDRCGHIMEGFLDRIPTTPAFPAGMHGLMFVGTAQVDNFFDDPAPSLDETDMFTTRSQHVLLWSHEKMEVIDLDSKIALLRLPILNPTKYKPDWIIDIQVSPVNQNHILVLTKRHLYWIDLFALERKRGEQEEEEEEEQEEEAAPRPVILVKCSHLVDGEGLRMSTCGASDAPGQNAIMVITYSPKQMQMHTYWFSCSAQGIPQWHRQLLALPREQSSLDLATEIQSLEIHFARLVPLGGPASGPGTHYHESGVRFYQGSILRKDLSVRYWICASLFDQSMAITLPTGRVGQFRTDQAQRWKKKRRHFLRHVDRTFVLPDGIDELSLNSLVRQNRSADTGPQSLRTQGPIHFKFDTLVQAIQEVSRSYSAKRDVSPALISAIYETIDDGALGGRLPLTTWKNIEDEMPPLPPNADNDEAQHDMLDLLLKDDGETVVTQLGRRPNDGSFESLNVLSELTRSFSNLWLEPLEGKISPEDDTRRQDWVTDLARDAFLSTSGVMVQDVPLFGAEYGAQEEVIGSSQPHRSSSIPIKSSQSSNTSIASSPVSTTSIDIADATIRRLQLLAPMLRSDKMASAKPSSVLSYWPKERGVSTHDYVSSVAIASERQFDEARKRLKKAVDRRKSHAEKYKLPPLMRPGASQMGRRRSEVMEPGSSSQAPVRAPAVPMQIMSSQQQRIPGSSQSQGLGPSVAMSQPMPGVFGDRKKAKKPKRKSGFR